MKRITIEIDDAYGEVLTISTAGRDGLTLNVATSAINLLDTNKVKIDEKGKFWLKKESEDTE